MNFVWGKFASHFQLNFDPFQCSARGMVVNGHVVWQAALCLYCTQMCNTDKHVTLSPQHVFDRLNKSHIYTVQEGQPCRHNMSSNSVSRQSLR